MSTATLTVSHHADTSMLPRVDTLRTGDTLTGVGRTTFNSPVTVTTIERLGHSLLLRLTDAAGITSTMITESATLVTLDPPF